MKSCARLISIQSTVLRFVQVLSRMLNLDVEVVDDNLVRIAGTGPYSSDLGRPLTTGTNAFKSVINSRKYKVIENSGKDPECLMCCRRVSCLEKAFLGVPVMFHGDCIGVVSLVCFNAEQRERLLGNIDLYMESIENVAQLFIAKTMESLYHDKVKDSEHIIKVLGESLLEGFLELDSKGFCQSMNRAAKLQLGICENSRITGVQVRPFGRKRESKQGVDDFIIMVAGKEKILPGKMLKLDKQRILLLCAAHKPQVILGTYGIKTELIGESRAVIRLKQKIDKIVNSPSSVLIHGESGSGKEVVARIIHEAGNRRHQPFVAINCAAIPEQLLESELFGYARGAFTGASAQGRDGLVKKADGGILFLDEIGDMPLYLQAKLLRVLDRREITPVGTSSVIPVNIRVISATHQDFFQLLDGRRFREDLYYRLNVIPLELAPLREREGDVELLVNYFLAKHAKALGIPKPVMDKDAMTCLRCWHWPGNVRELANTVEYLANMVDPGGVITPHELPDYFLNKQKSGRNPEGRFQGIAKSTHHSEGTGDWVMNEFSAHQVPSSPEKSSLKLEDMEKQLIEKALEYYGPRGGKQKVADELGIGIATLYRKIKKFGLDDTVEGIS